MTDDFEKMLQAKFAEEDACLSDEAFVATVMDDVRRSDLMRKVVLAIAAAAGGLIAGSQLPQLISTMSGISLIDDVTLTDLVRGLPEASGLSNMVWVLIAGMLTLTGLAVFSTDRI